MTFRIQSFSDGRTTTIRLVGQVQAEHLQILNEQIRSVGRHAVLDLDEVTLVDLEVVHYLEACEEQGIEILNAPPYVRNWIRREQDRQK